MQSEMAAFSIYVDIYKEKRVANATLVRSQCAKY